MKKRTLALLAALVLLFGLGSGGTLAYLYENTTDVKNTFVIGDVNVELTETGATDGQKTYDYVPGDTLAKDPKVTVKGGSEASYVFVKVVVANNSNGSVNPVVDWAIANGWTFLSTTASSAVAKGNGTYYFYRTQAATGSDVTYDVLSGNQVTVSNAIVKDQVSSLTSAAPTLTFTAAIIQQGNLADVKAAFNQLPAAFRSSHTAS